MATAELKTKTLLDVLDDYGANLVSELTDNLEVGRKNASGTLSASIRYRVKLLGQKYVFELSMADYWKFVDKGRAPGKQPPIKSILQWLTNRRLGSYIRGKGRNKAAPGGSILATNLREQRALAYLIARKIGRKGTKGSGFYTDAFKPGHAGDVAELERDLAQVMGREVKVFLKEL